MASVPSRNVTLLGQRDDMHRLMALADVYCQPNIAPEPFGLAIAEAMSAGLPCVVSRAGGASELVTDDCGILTSPGDALGVANALQTLITDRPRRMAMGAAAKLRVATLTDAVARVEELADVLNLTPAHATVQPRATVV
jgi:glycosyltransferase involved in cell wall biosynthesis